MGYRNYFAVHVELPTSTPQWVIAYLSSVTQASSPVSTVEVPAAVSSRWADLPDAGWFVPPWTEASLQDRNQADGFWVFRLNSVLRDDRLLGIYMLASLLAMHARNTTIGAAWTDMDDDVTTFIAHDGRLFAASLANTPAAVFEADGALSDYPGLKPRLSYETVAEHCDRESLVQMIMASPGDDPAFARYLLVRAIDLAVTEVTGPQSTELASAIVERVLAVLDAGRDEGAALTAPGWELAETIRTNSSAPLRTVRTVRDLVEMYAAIRAASGAEGS